MVNARVPFTFFFAFTLSLAVVAQKIPLINSGRVIKEGITLYDSGKYEDAISLFKTVPKRDTNYVYMLSELALAYNADKNYKEAIKACEEGLKYPSTFRAHLMRSLGTAWDHEGDLEKSVNVFEEAIKEFPYDYSLHFNLGVTYYNHKQYDKAKECFFNTLSINPYHSSSHLNLGRLSAFQGKKVRAMMSLGVYLSISNSDNEHLVFLERFLNNELKEDGTFPFKGSNPFEKLDQIIRAKIVTDKNFKPRVPIKAILVRQYQLLFDQLSLIENDPDDDWIKFYLPLYQSMVKDDMLEPFLYHILTSTRNEDVVRWTKKNEKKLNQFYTLANSGLRAHRKEKTLPEGSGFKNPVPFWYDDNNHVESIGHKNAQDNPVGKWIYYSPNGVKIAEGEWDSDGNKIKTWTYYRDNGSRKSVENYSNGEISSYNHYNEPVNRYYLKDDKVDGDVEVYYACGQLKERLTYSNGERSGPGKTFFLNGKIELEYNYKNDKLDGPYVVYYEDGKMWRKFNYKDGLEEGVFEEYYGDGTLKIKGTSKEGKSTGRWEYFHMNGKLERYGNYENGLPVGEWVYYDTDGKLTERRPFDEKGEMHGEKIIYHNSKVYWVTFYDHGKVIRIKYFNNEGKELGHFGDPSGTFAAKGFYPGGQLKYEGAYKNGKAHGQWKHYYLGGQLEKEYNCVNDSVHGELIEYFKSGDVKLKLTYNHGTLHGYSTEYFINGNVKEEGWFQDGNREQQWLTYFSDGTVENDVYYLQGSFTGEYFEYAVDGKLYSVYNYRDGRVVGFTFFNAEGKVVLSRELEGGKEESLQKYSNGKNRSRFEFTCGTFSGEIRRWLPNGNLYSLNPIYNGKRHGRYQYFHLNGKLEIDGFYVQGNETGKWLWYHDNGKVYSEGFYINGLRDSVWTYFSRNGIKTSTVKYKDDERHGVTQVFSPEGILIIEKLYDNGDLLAYRGMDEDGEFNNWKTFTGNETITAYFANGQKAFEEPFRNGLLDGPDRMYYQNGKLYYEYLYKKGDSDGPFVSYYVDGKVMKRGNYRWDELEGQLEYHNQDGSVRQRENYRMGVRHGKTNLYNSDGSVADEINFWTGTIVE